MNLLHVQELGAELEGQREVFAENLPILLNLYRMTVLKLPKRLCILFLGLQEVVVPLLVEFLILLDVGLFALLALLGLIEDELLVPPIVVVLLELINPVLCHLGLNVLAFLFAGVTMVFEHLAVETSKSS